MKQEKRLKKFEEEMKLRHCDATDTPLNTMKAWPLDHAYAGPERFIPCVRHAPTDGSPPVCPPHPPNNFEDRGSGVQALYATQQRTQQPFVVLSGANAYAFPTPAAAAAYAPSLRGCTGALTCALRPQLARRGRGLRCFRRIGTSGQNLPSLGHTHIAHHEHS